MKTSLSKMCDAMEALAKMIDLPEADITQIYYDAEDLKLKIAGISI